MIRNERDNYGNLDLPIEERMDTRVQGDYQEPEYISIQVSDPVNHTSAGKNTFTTYLITTQTTFPQYRERDFSVRRRYSEFVALRKLLVKYAEDNPKGNKRGGSIPVLPRATTPIIGPDRFNPAFVEERRKGLNAFLESVANHVICRFCPQLVSFLQDQEFQVK